MAQVKSISDKEILISPIEDGRYLGWYQTESYNPRQKNLDSYISIGGYHRMGGNCIDVVNVLLNRSNTVVKNSANIECLREYNVKINGAYRPEEIISHIISNVCNYEFKKESCDLIILNDANNINITFILGSSQETSKLYEVNKCKILNLIAKELDVNLDDFQLNAIQYVLRQDEAEEIINNIKAIRDSGNKLNLQLSSVKGNLLY